MVLTLFRYSPLSQNPSDPSAAPRSWRPSLRNVRTILSLVVAALLFVIMVSLTSFREPIARATSISNLADSTEGPVKPSRGSKVLATSASHGTSQTASAAAAKTTTEAKPVVDIMPIETIPTTFTTSSLQATPTPSIKANDTFPGASEVDWNQFAYVQYVTNYEYLCNSVMIFESLHRLGCRAQRLMMHPQEFTPSPDTPEGRLLAQARDSYGVTLQPITVQSKDTAESTWSESYTKLLAMNMTAHARRVLSLDSDSTVLQCLDELFLLPSSPVAMPRAYWEWPAKYELSSQLLLVETSSAEFRRIMREVDKAGDNEFDMDILNELYLANAMVLPHRQYDLVTGEFRHNRSDHARYLGSPAEKWDPRRVVREAKFVHFSDWPIPKPWVAMGKKEFREHGPKCEGEDCGDRDMWVDIYGDFRRRREEVCGIDVGGYIQKHRIPI